jgi:iron complex transport system substrate-binding protein
VRQRVTGVRLRTLVGSAALALAVSGCGLASGSSNTVTTSWSCEGPSTATVADTSLQPLEPKPVAQLPVTYTDYAGDDITVTDTSRVLALDTYGTLGTTVYALGLGDQLVGRDISTTVPALADLPVVTYNGHELNAEAILELNPTVVLTDYSIGPLEVQLQLKEAGIPVVILDGERSRDRIAPQIEAVATVLGVEEAGTTLAAQVTADVAAAEAEIAELAPDDVTQRPRIAFLYIRGTAGVYYWFGKESGADDLIAALQGVDVAGETGLVGQQPLTSEGLVKADPDLYLMMTKGLESVGGVEGLAERPGVAETTAGRTGCVVDMNDSQILSFGPQFPATLRALGAAVYDS